MDDDALSIKLELDKTECIRGESVFFKVTITNDGQTPITEFPEFDEEFKTVSLRAESRRRQMRAGQLSADHRDGVPHHDPQEPVPTVTLGPAESVTLTGDLLEWFGGFYPDTFDITASHIYGLESEPVRLTVRPSVAVTATTPRIAAQNPTAPITGAWIHDETGENIIFYEQQSPVVPRNPRHCVRVDTVDDPVEPRSAGMSDSTFDTGHVVWLVGKKLNIASVTIGDDAAVAKGDIKAPFAGKVLSSPLSTPGPSVWIPLANEKGDEAAVIHVSDDGTATTHPTPLGQTTPIGPYACFWEYDLRLHFFWAAENGREVQHARLPLTDPDAGFVVRSAFVSDDPIIWLDAYIDRDAPFKEAPYFAEQIPAAQRDRPQPPPPPPTMLWCVAATPSALHCTRVHTARGFEKERVTLGLHNADKMTPLSSIVTNENYEFALLLADENGKLFYASTALRYCDPLEKFVGESVTMESMPALVTASDQGTSPWVYLRYIGKEKSVRYIRIEPRDELDPVERSSEPVTERRARS